MCRNATYATLVLGQPVLGLRSKFVMSVKSAHKTISEESFFFRQSVNHVINSQITIFNEQQVT